MEIESLNPADYDSIVFFTGAGMSAESGVPTYRGKGGIWEQYNWEQFACERAFRADPEKVLQFHNLRRRLLDECQPHAGHMAVAELERNHPQVTIVTQNIDGLHQLARSQRVIELHGSLWRMRCPSEGIIIDLERGRDADMHCTCGDWLRPDITWFGDSLNLAIMGAAGEVISRCDLFVAVGTSGVVWPAAGFPQEAKNNGARCVEINTEDNEMSYMYENNLRGPAGEVLPGLFARTDP